MLKKEDNPKFYDIIKEFEKLTGVGAVLNTSFNIHGEPIVCNPHEAISTLKRSGLRYLIMEQYLITKL
jgi:carbamoyltransferase